MEALPANSLLGQYFTLTEKQSAQFNQLLQLYPYWNAQINVISRKDMEALEEHHLLHSLAVAKRVSFLPGSQVLDVGTGGGLPGLPLAIIFPEVSFTLVDSIGKKIKVVEALVKELNLLNVIPLTLRVEQLPPGPRFDFVVSRAVNQLTEFWPWVAHRFLRRSNHPLTNGLLALKGGDLDREIETFGKPAEQTRLSTYFPQPFFSTKSIVYVPAHRSR